MARNLQLEISASYREFSPENARACLNKTKELGAQNRKGAEVIGALFHWQVRLKSAFVQGL